MPCLELPLVSHPFSHLFDQLRRSLQGHPRSMAASDSKPRIEVCPPTLARTAQSEPIGLRGWIGAVWLDSSSSHGRPQRRPERRATPLLAVRAEFIAAIAGIDEPKAARLEDGIHKARSLRELWHLRADVYTLVATHHGETEAQRRLEPLNRHFATRSARLLQECI